MVMFLKVKYLLIAYPMLFQIVASELSKNIPVFIVDNERVLSKLSPPKSPFTTFNKEQFGDVAKDALRRSDRVVIFMEDTLAAEDVSSRDKLGSPYYLLRQGIIDGSVKYYPSVEDPFRVLQDIFPMTEYNTFQLDSKTSKLRLYDSNIRHTYIFFKDNANMSRIEALRQHDLIMREVHHVVKQRADGPVVAFYTAKVNPNALHRVEESPFAWETKRDAIWCRNTKVILAVEGLRIMHKNKQMPLPPTDLGEVACTYQWNRDDHPDEMTVAMPLASHTLQCRLTFSDVTWTLVNCHLHPVSGSEELRGGEGAHLDIRRTLRYANTFQYNEPLYFTGSDGNGVVVKKITVEVVNQPGQTKFSLTQEGDEPPQSDDPPSPPQSEDSPDPPPNAPPKEPQSTPPETPKQQGDYIFTEPLLTCFLISAILLSLMIYGFSSLAAVKSNSRYDDPKGKPLMFAES